MGAEEISSGLSIVSPMSEKTVLVMAWPRE